MQSINRLFTHYLEGKKLLCRIRRSRRARHIGLKINEEGIVQITLPFRYRSVDPGEILHRHRRWIITHHEKVRQKKKSPPFTIEDGAILPLAGHECILHIIRTAGRKSSLQFSPPHIFLRLSDLPLDRAYPLVQSWYKRMAENFLRERVPYWAQRIRVSPEAVRVKNQKTLWGSCSRKRNMNFNWRIILLSPEAADYLIIHELCHLKHMNHSPAFWESVERHCPDYKQRKKELRERNHWLRFPENLNV